MVYLRMASQIVALAPSLEKPLCSSSACPQSFNDQKADPIKSEALRDTGPMELLSLPITAASTA